MSIDNSEMGHSAAAALESGASGKLRQQLLQSKELLVLLAEPADNAQLLVSLTDKVTLVAELALERNPMLCWLLSDELLSCCMSLSPESLRRYRNFISAALDVLLNQCEGRVVEPLAWVTALEPLRALRGELLPSALLFQFASPLPSLSHTSCSTVSRAESLVSHENYGVAIANVLSELGAELISVNANDTNVGVLQQKFVDRIEELPNDIAQAQFILPVAVWFVSALVDSKISPAKIEVLRQLKTAFTNAELPFGDGVAENTKALLSSMLFYVIQSPLDTGRLSEVLQNENYISQLRLLAESKSLESPGETVLGFLLAVLDQFSTLKLQLDSLAREGQPKRVQLDVLARCFGRLTDMLAIANCRQPVLKIQRARSALVVDSASGDSASVVLDSAERILQCEYAFVEQFAAELADLVDTSLLFTFAHRADPHECNPVVRDEMLREIATLLQELNSVEGLAANRLRDAFKSLAGVAEFLPDAVLADRLYEQFEYLEQHEPGSGGEQQEMLYALRNYLRVQDFATSEENVQAVDSFSTSTSMEVAPVEMVRTDSSSMQERPAEISTQQPPVAAAVPIQVAAFSEACNAHIDTIQLALDSALGTTGNLVPDSRVVGALQDLLAAVRSAGFELLVDLLDPLEAIISRAEQVGGTLNTIDTLLVQEGVIAATLGVDSMVNNGPMPELIADVSTRLRHARTNIDLRLSRDNSDELLDVFVEEASERLPKLYATMQRWRGSPSTTGRVLSDIRRALHNLKGAANSVGLTSFAQLTHHLETALERFVDAGNEHAEAFFQVALSCVEEMLEDVDNIRAGESLAGHQELHLALDQWGDFTAHAIDPVVPPAQPSPSSLVVRQAAGTELPIVAPRSVTAMGRELLQAGGQSKAHLQALLTSMGELQTASGDLSTTIKRHFGRPVEGVENPHTKEQLEEQLGAVSQHLQQSLQVLATRLKMHGECLDQINLLVEQSRNASLQLLYKRLQAIVEQVALANKRSVDLKLLCDQSDLPVDALQLLAQPLEQLVQNAIVHGIESPEQRRDIGKAETGQIEVKIQQSLSEIVVEVVDDGGGVDFGLLQTAVSRRYPSLDSGGVDNSQLLNYLAEQGISTAANANLNSGRGVGLESIVSALQSHGASLRVTTGFAEGSGFRATIVIPVSHYWQMLRLVRTGDAWFAVDATWQLAEEADSELTAGSVTLADLLAVPVNPSLGAVQILKNSVLAEAPSLVVDEVASTRQMQVFSGEEQFRKVPGYNGAVVLDDGLIAPVLDLTFWLAQAHRSDGVVATPSSAMPVPIVLVIEDSATLRALIARALMGVRCRCEFARDAVEAIEMLNICRPSLVLLDLKLPRGDGFAVARAIRRIDDLKLVPVVLTTSVARQVVEGLLAEIGPAGYLEKPYTGDELARLVAGVLKGITSSQELVGAERSR